MTKVYKNNFRFIADRYEEWQAGHCISQGPISTEIVAEVSGDSIHFELDDIGNLRILQSFDFECKDSDWEVLHDRVQYRHSTSDFNPIVPLFCNLFYSYDDINYVRFAMTNPDRLIEFYGEMVELGQPSKGKRSYSVVNKITSAYEVKKELKSYGMFNANALMERAVDIYNDNADIAGIDNANAIAEALKLFVDAYKLERCEVEEEGRECSFLIPKILMFIALCNFKVGNVNSAYYIAKKALNEINYVVEHSILSGIPREMYGESTILELIDVIENNHWEDVDKDINSDDIDETEIDLDNLYNLQHEINRETLAAKNPEARRIKQLVDVVNKVQKQYWEAGQHFNNTEKQVQFHSLFELIKNALYYSWEKFGYGNHSDFWNEGDSMFDYLMFEMGPEERINAIIQILEQSSPFAPIERDSAITNDLLSVFNKVLNL